MKRVWDCGSGCLVRIVAEGSRMGECMLAGHWTVELGDEELVNRQRHCCQGEC